jgi:hypothetical protein
MKLVVIGAFECAKKAPFPSHVPPILAEQSSQGFRRVFYDASLNPFETSSEGGWEQHSQDLLKHLSVIRTEPKPYAPGNQIVYLGDGNLIIDSSKIRISFLLLPHVFSRRFFRTLRTFVNVYS